jgi:tetratricopeptide (TPR) repeat protein
VVEGRGRFGSRDRAREDRPEPVRRLPIPEDVTGLEVDPSVRQELKSLPKTLADDVARNLVMVARLLDTEPEKAYAYSRVALRLASRVAGVREAAGFASYVTEKYSEALTEFRAARRMSGSTELWPVMADCERGLGRPERALAMAGAPEVRQLDRAGQVEMRLVAAGARRDLGQADAAVVTLQGPELASTSLQPWTARLRYAYADALLEVGREAEARDWFARALEADHNGTTDASDRLAELDGLEFVDALDPAADEADGENDHEGSKGTEGSSGSEVGAEKHGADGVDADAADEGPQAPEAAGHGTDDEVAGEPGRLDGEHTDEAVADKQPEDREETEESGRGEQPGKAEALEEAAPSRFLRSPFLEPDEGQGPASGS